MADALEMRSRDRLGWCLESAPRHAALLLVGGTMAFSGVGTSAGMPSAPEGWCYEMPDPGTTSSWRAQRPLDDGSAVAVADLGDAASAVLEVRRISGLTWEQLASVLGVSRRAVHLWAAGRPLQPANEAVLRQVLTVVRLADREQPSATRRFLFGTTDASGNSIFELMQRRELDGAKALARSGSAPMPVVVPRGTVAPQEMATRRPPTPDVLAGALEEPIHKDLGRVLRTVKVPKKRNG